MSGAMSLLILAVAATVLTMIVATTALVVLKHDKQEQNEQP